MRRATILGGHSDGEEIWVGDDTELVMIPVPTGSITAWIAEPERMLEMGFRTESYRLKRTRGGRLIAVHPSIDHWV